MTSRGWETARIDNAVASLPTLAQLLDDYDFRVPRTVAGAALARGAEGIVVPSATRLGDNLIVFPTNLRADSTLVAVRHRDLDHLRLTPRS